MRPNKRRSIIYQSERRGVATVEFAFVLPVLLILTFGSIELCQRVFVKQSLVISVYEGARLATRKTSTAQDVVTRCQTLLAQRNVSGGQITVQPANLMSTVSGDEIHVSIQIPLNQNVISRYVVSDQGNLTVQATMLRE